MVLLVLMAVVLHLLLLVLACNLVKLVLHRSFRCLERAVFNAKVKIALI